MRYGQAISRRKVTLLAALALVASLLFALTSSRAPQADAQPASCDVQFVEPGPSPVIETGTRTGVTVVCDVRPQTVGVVLDVDAGDILVLHEDVSTTIGGLNAKLVKTIDVAVPPINVGVCVTVLGETHCI